MKAKRVWFAGLTLAAVALPAALSAQVAVAGRAGTLGVGGEAGLELTRQIGLRGGVNFQPWEPTIELDEVEFTVQLPSPTYHAMVDLYPMGGGFRLSGGLTWFSSSVEVTARPTEPVEVGDQTYSPQEVGELLGEFETKEMAPYVGLGFGRLGGRRGVGFLLDLGVAFHGEPSVSLSATGPLSNQAAFQANLAEEEANINEDARKYRVYPVLAIGLAIGF
jgi:hypothetical protein